MARSWLPLELFQRLLEQVCDRLRDCVDTAAGWHGHRAWMMDGSSCSMPDTPELQRAFGQPAAQADRQLSKRTHARTTKPAVSADEA